MRTGVCIFLLAALLGISFQARTQSLGFENIQLIDRSEIEIRESRSLLPFARQAEVLLRTETAPPPPDSSLGRPVAQLYLDRDAFLAVRVSLRSAQPREAMLVDFTVAGNPIRMLAIESQIDADFEAMQMTLLAVSPEDYARLTISRSGPEIVGTVFVDDQWYRILPDENDPESQLVYPLAVKENAWQRDTQPLLDTRAGQLEARHLQMAWVAETQPDTFATYTDGRPRTYLGPGIGILDFWDALIVDPAGNGEIEEAVLKSSTERFLNNAQSFTWVYDGIEVQLEPQDLDDVNTIAADGLEIEMTQLINGIPISRMLNLSMDPTGDVVGFSGTLMRRAMAGIYADGPRILQDEARASARQALNDEHGIESTGEFPAEKLFYNAIADDELQLIWRMSVQASCGMVFDVDIDAFSGESNRIGQSVESQGVEIAENRGRNAIFGDVFSRCRYALPR